METPTLIRCVIRVSCRQCVNRKFSWIRILRKLAGSLFAVPIDITTAPQSPQASRSHRVEAAARRRHYRKGSEATARAERLTHVDSAHRYPGESQARGSYGNYMLRTAMVVVFGSANAFGRDVDEKELMLLTATVFVVSLLIVLVYKLARGWEDDDKHHSILPLHRQRRVTTRWVKTRKQHYGKLGTIMEHEQFIGNLKRM